MKPSTSSVVGQPDLGDIGNQFPTLERMTRSRETDGAFSNLTHLSQFKTPNPQRFKI